MTEYIVLEKTGDGRWLESSLPFEATSKTAAIRHHLGTDGATGEYVAVPARSWQPVKVQVETALKFS